MAGEHPHAQSRPDAKTQANLAALESYLRLQQHQAEYLEWLEATEKKTDVDSYAYKKIR